MTWQGMAIKCVRGRVPKHKLNCHYSQNIDFIFFDSFTYWICSLKQLKWMYSVIRIEVINLSWCVQLTVIGKTNALYMMRIIAATKH